MLLVRYCKSGLLVKGHVITGGSCAPTPPRSGLSRFPRSAPVANDDPYMDPLINVLFVIICLLPVEVKLIESFRFCEGDV